MLPDSDRRKTPVPTMYNRCKISEYRDNSSQPAYRSMLKEAENDLVSLADKCVKYKEKAVDGTLSQTDRMQAQRGLEDAQAKLEAVKSARDALLARNHKHARDDSTVYQIVKADGSTRVVDEGGQTLPEGAVYSYTIEAVDVTPPGPVQAAGNGP